MNDIDVPPGCGIRKLGEVHTIRGKRITVAHAFIESTTFTGLPLEEAVLMAVGESGEEDSRSMLLNPAEAIQLAERLRRAAGIVLESAEDLPNILLAEARATQLARKTRQAEARREREDGEDSDDA